jgi:hypothetical protein
MVMGMVCGGGCRNLKAEYRKTVSEKKRKKKLLDASLSMFLLAW